MKHAPNLLQIPGNKPDKSHTITEKHGGGDVI